MSSNDDTIIDVQALAHDDLLDAYEKLAKAYRRLKENHDNLNQKLHHEISQRKIFENSLNDVQGELDSINEVHLEKLSVIERKSEEHKEKNHKLIMENLALENRIDEMSCLIKVLENECTELKAAVLEKKIKPRYSDTYSKSLELENDSLRKNNNGLQEKVLKLTEESEFSKRVIEDLTESVNCIRDNFESKKAELEEKKESIEQLQEKMHELSSELALLKNSTDLDESNRKGNSLFAEVDDQRQKMKKILQGERSHYYEMKKAVNAREMEIRRLKRENLNIKSEIETCNRLLKRAEQLSMENTRIYITQLECETQSLQKQLREQEEKLTDVLTEKKLLWVETVMTSTAKESRDLKDKNFVLLREKMQLVDSHSKTLRDLSKVRADGIKLKTLLGRIVEDYKIRVDESQYIDLGIEREIFENLHLESHEAMESFDDSKQQEMKEDEGQDQESMGEMLNESTIILLGGRERLGNAIPKQEVPVIVKVEEKENNFIVPKAVPVKMEAIKTQTSPLKEKSVQFSSNVTTKVIDSAPEQLQASVNARKKPAFTVKRITIPSMPRKIINDSSSSSSNNK